MTGKVFWETLRGGWRQALYGAVGLAMFGAYSMLLLPDTAGLQGFVKLMEAMPSEMMQAIGVDDPAMMATPEGFIGFAFFTYGAILLSVFAIFAGLSLTANDEESGAMNMLLALPLPRWRVVVERAAAQVIFAFVIALGGWVSLVVMRSFNPYAESLDPLTLLKACMAFVPVILTIMALTAVLGALIRRRNIAGAVAGAFVAASYLMSTLGGMAGPGIGELMQKLSIYTYFDGSELARNGLDLGVFVVFSLIAAVLAAVAVGLFDRRDITA
jgi:ABC-2 type transport system permease protein